MLLWVTCSPLRHVVLKMHAVMTATLGPFRIRERRVVFGLLVGLLGRRRRQVGRATHARRQKMVVREREREIESAVGAEEEVSPSLPERQCGPTTIVRLYLHFGDGFSASVASSSRRRCRRRKSSSAMTARRRPSAFFPPLFSPSTHSCVEVEHPVVSGRRRDRKC